MKNILAFNVEPLLLVILFISDVGICCEKVVVVVVSGEDDVWFIAKEEFVVFKEVVVGKEEVLVFKEVVVGDGKEEVLVFVVVWEFSTQLTFIEDIDNINGE